MTDQATHTVDALMAQTFPPDRTQRSAAYRAGARCWFARHLTQSNILCPYRAGSAEFDAFWAGSDEACVLIMLKQIPTAMHQEASHVL